MSSAAVTIAKRDFLDVARSRILWGAIGVLLVVTIPDYFNMVTGELIDSPEQAVRFIPVVFQNFVAPIAMITAYRSIVGERESGSLRVLFGHPATRRDFVFGKLLSRSVFLAVIFSIVSLGMGFVTIQVYGSVPILLFIAITGYVASYAIVWAGITVGVSSAVSSRLQSISIVLGLFLFFGPFHLWDRLAVPLFALIFSGRASTAGINELDPSTWPIWYQYTLRLNPIRNFANGRYFIPDLVDPGFRDLATVDLLGILVLVFWFAVPILLGYWRFESVDLK